MKTRENNDICMQTKVLYTVKKAVFSGHTISICKL